MTQVNNMIPAISFVGEANNVPIPPNPYMEKYLYDQSKAILEIQKENEISRINEESKMRMEDHKAALKEKQLEGMARRSFLNDLAEYSVFVNEDGGFSLIKSLPNKEQELVENILNVRHAVSQMYDMGMDEKDIMALAGHSNVSTTRHYNRRLKEINMSEEQLSAGFGR